MPTTLVQKEQLELLNSASEVNQLNDPTEHSCISKQEATNQEVQGSIRPEKKASFTYREWNSFHNDASIVCITESRVKLTCMSQQAAFLRI